MFTITNETGIIYKNAEAFTFRIEGGRFTYTEADPDFNRLQEQFTSARDLTEKGRIVHLNGACHYNEKNAYGQTQYEGDLTAEESLAVVAIGTFIDLSDSDFVLVNCTEQQFWTSAAAILDAQLAKLSGFAHRKERKVLTPLAEYAHTHAQS